MKAEGWFADVRGSPFRCPTQTDRPALKPLGGV